MLYLSRKLNPFNGYNVAIGAAVAGAATSAVASKALSGHSGGGGGQPQQPQQPQGGNSGQQSIGEAMGNLYLTDVGAKNIQTAGQQAATMADPFAQSRQFANAQLQRLMQNPGQMANDPSYQWALGQGQQAVERSLAGRHMTSSGGGLEELMQYGQGMASQQYNNRLNQLYQMASQGASPSQAAQSYLGATETAQSGLAAGRMGLVSAASPLISSAGNMAGDWIKGLIGGGGSPDVAGVTPNYSSMGVDMTGFQNPNYSSFTPSYGSSYDYSTSFGTTPNYTDSSPLLSMSYTG